MNIPTRDALRRHVQLEQAQREVSLAIEHLNAAAVHYEKLVSARYTTILRTIVQKLRLLLR